MALALASFVGLVLGTTPPPLVGSLIIDFMAASLFGSLVLVFALSNQQQTVGDGRCHRSREGNGREGCGGGGGCGCGGEPLV